MSFTCLFILWIEDEFNVPIALSAFRDKFILDLLSPDMTFAVDLMALKTIYLSILDLFVRSFMYLFLCLMRLVSSYLTLGLITCGNSDQFICADVFIFLFIYLFSFFLSFFLYLSFFLSFCIY